MSQLTGSATIIDIINSFNDCEGLDQRGILANVIGPPTVATDGIPKQVSALSTVKQNMITALATRGISALSTDSFVSLAPKMNKDIHLIASNIISGVTIDGVAGGIPVHQTNITPSTSNQAIPYGVENGNGLVYGDSNLIGANVVKTASIFGVTGTAVEFPITNLTAGETMIAGPYINKTGYFDSISPGKITECKVFFSGTVRVTFTITNGQDGSTSYAQPYINNVAVGSLVGLYSQYTSPAAVGTYSEDIVVNYGDNVSIYGGGNSTKYTKSCAITTWGIKVANPMALANLIL